MKRTAAENSVIAKRIVQLFGETTLTMEQIADQCGCSWSFVSKVAKNMFSSAYRKERKSGLYRASKLGDLNPMAGKTGDEHHNFIGEVSDGKGYTMVLKPDWYTGRRGCKHIFTHHFVYCNNHGLTCIPRGYQVHHKDLDKTNNDIENLLLLTASEHTKLHSRLRRAETIRKE